MKKIIMFVAAICLAMSAQGAKMEGAPSAACEGLKVATGPNGKGYSKMFKNMVSVAGKDVALCEVNTEGGLENSNTLSTKGADLAFIPYDVLVQMGPGDPNIAALQVVATLNSNYLHIVTNARGIKKIGPKKYGILEGDTQIIQINKLSELRGARVALVGSAQSLVRQLDKSLGLKMDYVDVTGANADADAFKMVQDGRVLAAFTVAGWPHGALKNLTQASNLTLIPFDMPINGPYGTRSLNYNKLGVQNVSVLSVQNLLMTRPFSGAKTAEVAKLKRAIERELPELKDGEYEPGWNEINTLDGKVEWAKFQGAKAPPVAEKTARK